MGVSLDHAERDSSVKVDPCLLSPVSVHIFPANDVYDL